jgi:2-keto-3-deoxy-6-phosphogluconate aldolase
MWEGRDDRLDWLDDALATRTLVKAIAGIDNTDEAQVTAFVRSVNATGVQAIDIAGKPSLVSAIRQITGKILFASSVVPSELAAAVEAGADVVELGNYDALYAQGQFFDQHDVYALTLETLRLIGGTVPICVTIPGHLSRQTQQRLAQDLENLGISLIQTEGASRWLQPTQSIKTLDPVDKFALSATNTSLLAEAVDLPIMTASGVTADNAREALKAGASAVGVGTSVRNLPAALQVEALNRVYRQIMTFAPANFEDAPLAMAV